MKLHGIYHVLSVSPIWATFVILFGLFSAIFIGRDFLEGLPYQVAYSASIGEGLCFIAMVLIVVTILQRGRWDYIRIPKWLQNNITHGEILLMSMAICTIVSVLTIESRLGDWMDAYHDLVVAPLILYFGVTLLPVIKSNGTPAEKKATCFFIALWIGCFIFDLAFGRINQFTWLLNHGVTLVR